MVSPKYHIFVCTSCRTNGTQKGLCHTKSSVGIIEKFMEEVEDRDLSGDVMITNTGCFGICSRGPILLYTRKAYGTVILQLMMLRQLWISILKAERL